MPPENRYELTIQSTFDDLENVVDQTEAFFSEHSDNPEFIYTAVLLASEAVTNAIEHGNKSNASRKVRITFLNREKDMEMRVEDEGDGFVREDIPDPLSEENILDDGGRGIFLIERLADEVRYEQGGRRVVIVLTKK